MSGLIDTPTGLRYGESLIWEPGLGGAGLINPSRQLDTAEFDGAGSLRVNATIRTQASAVFSGAGSLRATAS